MNGKIDKNLIWEEEKQQYHVNSKTLITQLDIIASKVDSWVEHSSFKIERCRPPLCQARALVSPQFELEMI